MLGNLPLKHDKAIHAATRFQYEIYQTHEDGVLTNELVDSLVGKFREGLDCED